MLNLISELIVFVEGYFEVKCDERSNDILFRRFGINYERTYTLDEIGILYNGISRERVRQIEAMTIKELRILLKGLEIKKMNFVCNASLVEKAEEIRRIVINHKVTLSEQIAQLLDMKKNDGAWLKLLIEVLGFKTADSSLFNDYVIFSDQYNAKEFMKEVERVFGIIRDSVIPINIDDLMIIFKKGRRKFDDTICHIALGILVKGNVVEVDRNKYLISFEYLSSAGDMGRRILFKENKPLTSSEIFILINKKLASMGRDHIKLRNLENQIINNESIRNIGGKKWSLKEWNTEKKYIKQYIIDTFLESGEPLSKEDIIRTVHSKRNDIKDVTIIGYLSYDEFVALSDGRMILKEWKNKYTDRIKKKRKRRDIDKIIVSIFHYYEKRILTRTEIWDIAKTKYTGSKYNFFGQISKKKYLYIEKQDNNEMWILKEDYKEMIAFSHGNILKMIGNLAENIIDENHGTILLNELVEMLMKKYNYVDKTIYQVLNNKKKFIKVSGIRYQWSENFTG